MPFVDMKLLEGLFGIRSKIMEDFSDRTCGECLHCMMQYDRHDWEIFSCNSEFGRGCELPEDTACRYFEEVY